MSEGVGVRVKTRVAGESCWVVRIETYTNMSKWTRAKYSSPCPVGLFVSLCASVQNNLNRTKCVRVRSTCEVTV